MALPPSELSVNKKWRYCKMQIPLECVNFMRNCVPKLLDLGLIILYMHMLTQQGMQNDIYRFRKYRVLAVIWNKENMFCMGLHSSTLSRIFYLSFIYCVWFPGFNTYFHLKEACIYIYVYYTKTCITNLVTLSIAVPEIKIETEKIYIYRLRKEKGFINHMS